MQSYLGFGKSKFRQYPVIPNSKYLAHVQSYLKKKNAIIFRTYRVIFRTTVVIFRTHQVIFTTNRVTFRTNPFIFRRNLVTLGTYFVIFNNKKQSYLERIKPF